MAVGSRRMTRSDGAAAPRPAPAGDAEPGQVAQVQPFSLARPAPREADLDLSRIEGTLGALLRTMQCRSFRDYYEAFGHLGLTPARHAALDIIASNPGVLQVQVANVLGLQGPNMAKLVKEFERDGLIVRERNARDARGVGLALSDRGKAMLDAIEGPAKDVDRSTASALTDIEFQLLLQLLLKALGPLWNNNAGGGPTEF